MLSIFAANSLFSISSELSSEEWDSDGVDVVWISSDFSRLLLSVITYPLPKVAEYQKRGGARPEIDSRPRELRLR